MTILLVDDNPDITDLVSKYLKSNGYENIISNNSKEGLKKILNQRFDYIFLDIHMPELSGLDIIQKLEEQDKLDQLKIVIFSAHNFTPQQIEELLRKDGIHGYLKKPIQLNKLLASIAN